MWGSHLHRIYTYEFQKRGLCAFDDKRYINEDGISTYAYGHYKLGLDPTQTLVPVERPQETVLRFSEVPDEDRTRGIGLDVEYGHVPAGLDPDQVAAELRRRQVDAAFEGTRQPANMLELIDFIR